MENKNVGWMLLGISILLIVFTFLFNNTLMEAVKSSCFIQHGDVKSCEMYDSVNYQTYFALGVTGVMVIVSLFLIFSKPNEKIVIKKIKEKKVQKEINLSSFRSEEKQVYNLVKENGAIFQADLIEKTEFSKARMTRIIDKLEGSGLVERKRRGMTNVVVIKED
ncbi:MAG: MarR family transcriptional regulator [Nanoarchaeota archaeon]|nr:MarR family transcriptional regulator [Nanoarchaeota archaeon]